MNRMNKNSFKQSEHGDRATISFLRSIISVSMSFIMVQLSHLCPALISLPVSKLPVMWSIASFHLFSGCITFSFASQEQVQQEAFFVNQPCLSLWHEVNYLVVIGGTQNCLNCQQENLQRRVSKSPEVTALGNIRMLIESTIPYLTIIYLCSALLGWNDSMNYSLITHWRNQLITD